MRLAVAARVKVQAKDKIASQLIELKAKEDEASIMLEELRATRVYIYAYRTT